MSEVWVLRTLLLNGMLGLGGLWVARSGFRQPAGTARFLAAGILAWAWLTIGLELTGLLGWLRIDTLAIWSALGLGIGLALRWQRSETPSTQPANSRPVWDVSATLALGLVSWAALVLGSQSLLLPVKVMSDGPIYHLYFAARWWKEGRLFLIPAPFGESAAPYFPANGDLWFTWLMTCWGGDRLARVGQAPFLILAATAAFGMARTLGAGLSAAVIATAWFVACTPFLVFSFEANVDTIFVAAYLVAGYFFLRYTLEQSDTLTLALCGLAAGSALGTKAPAILFVPPLGILAVTAIATRSLPIRRKLGHLLTLLASTAVTSGFWYGRNAWLTGNPLYPLRAQAFGRVWLNGWYGTDVMHLSHYFLPASDLRAGGDILLGVLDPRLAPIWLAALLGGWAIGRRPLPMRRWVWLCSALAVANVALYWLLIPYRTQQRFMFQALGLAAVPLALLFERGRVVRFVGVLLLALHLLTPQAWPFASKEAEIPWDLSPRIPNAFPSAVSIPTTLEQWKRLESVAAKLSLGGTLALGLGSISSAWAWGRYVQKPSKARRLGATALSAAVASAAVGLFNPWSAPKPPFYPFFPEYYTGWNELERLSPPQGARVAYAGTDLPYYLLGCDLRNEVRYVNVDGHRDWLLHDYHREALSVGQPTWPHPRPGWDRVHPDFHAWLANLTAEGIELLVVTRANPQEGPHNVYDTLGFPIERSWAESHDQDFIPLYGVAERDPQFRIYRLRRPAAD